MSDGKSIIERAKNRLEHSKRDDELLDGSYLAYQRVLDEAYDYAEADRLGDACKLLEQAGDYLRSPYQRVRTAYLFAKYCVELEAHGAKTDPRGQPDPIGTAVDCYASAAEIAREIPDLALAAWLKLCESLLCYVSNPYSRRYRRAMVAAQAALRLWQRLPDRIHTLDLHFEFELSDAIGVRAQMVAEDGVAVASMERAALLLLTLRGREDRDSRQYLNDAFLLDWDWAAIDRSRGKFKLALVRAIQARDQALHSSTLRNFGRVNTLIAEIALDCFDRYITWKRFDREVLLNVAERAVDHALKSAPACGDGTGYVMALLANARWLRQTRWKDERHAVLKLAEKLAASVKDTDPVLVGRVEIAWGDEFAFLYMKRKSLRRLEQARKSYQSAEQRMRDVEALGLARVARRRLLLLLRLANSPRKPRGTGRKPKHLPPDIDPSLN